MSNALLLHREVWPGRSGLVFLASIGIAQVNASAAEFSWLGIAVLIGLLRWRYRDSG